MVLTPLLQELITALRCLPGVGPKTAQRMAFHLLERDRVGGRSLVDALGQALQGVGHCRLCRILSELSICPLCESSRRDQQVLCVVETPADVLAIEQAGGYRGVYFVLMGRLSPIDGIGPQEIGVDLFRERLLQGKIEEVIMATSASVEGELTAHYLAELARSLGVESTRIAHGVPMGGELGHLDSGTVSRALAARSKMPV